MSEFESLLFYIISFFCSYILYGMYIKRTKKIYLILAFSIPLIIGGFRENVGTDYQTYIAMLKKPDGANLGFRIIAMISNFFNSKRCMFVIYEFLTLLFTFLGLKRIKEKCRPLALLLFLLMFYATGFNIMKQMLAVSIVFYAYKYLEEKNFVKWLIWMIIANMFHSTAIIFVLLYPIVNSKNKYLKIIMPVLFAVLVFYYSNIIILLTRIPIFAKFGVYADAYTKTTINNRKFYLELVVLLYIIFYKKKLNNYWKKNEMYCFLYLLGVILMATGFFSPYVKRIATYLRISKILLLAQIPYALPSKKEKLLNYVIIIGYALTSFIISVYVLGQADIVPYRFSIN